MSLLDAAVMFGIITAMFVSIAFGHRGNEKMRAHVAAHKWYYRTIVIILSLSELIIVAAAIASPRR